MLICFRQHCVRLAEFGDDRLRTASVIRAHYWARTALKDLHMPWSGSCQEIHDYVSRSGATAAMIENFYLAWEMSGRVVDVDVDSEESDTMSGSYIEDSDYTDTVTIKILDMTTARASTGESDDDESSSCLFFKLD